MPKRTVRPTKENVTMKTIAEEAGVTLTTVSRILNNKGGKYAEKTRDHILSIADRLKYRPNALVRGMQSGKTNTAGVMVPTFSTFYSQIVTGIHETFMANDVLMMVAWNSRSLNKKDDAHERQIIHQLVDRRVDGIILRPTCEEFESSYFEEIRERDIPLILVDREMSKVFTDFAGTNDEAGGTAAAEYLIALGHRQMLFVGAGEQVSTSRHREAGFRKVLSESANACCKTIDLDVNKKDAHAEILKLLKQKNRPTAIFCYNDPVAEYIASIVAESELSIPNDISLVGFGNEPSGNCNIALTTFDQHPQKIGQTAAKMYLERTRKTGKSETRRELILPDMIIRSSTKPLSRQSR